MQVRYSLSHKEDYKKGDKMTVNDDDVREHEQMFDKGAHVVDRYGERLWVFYTQKGGWVTVLKDDNSLEEKEYYFMSLKLV